MKRLPWLDRALTICSHYYCLRISEKDFWEELHQLEIPVGTWPKFLIHSHSHATTHFFEGVQGKRLAIVCIEPEAPNRDSVQVAALLVHEAVHIWQAHTRSIGSLNDHGDEEEAYAIQSIAQELMTSFRDQVYGKQ